MKRILTLILLQLVSVKSLVSQTEIKDTSNVHDWTMTGSVHIFTKQKIKQNYQPLPGLSIYTKPTTDFAFEVTRFFKLKKGWLSSLGFRLGMLSSDVGIDIAEDITRNGYPFDNYDKGTLPYIAFKGLIRKKVWEEDRLSIQQGLGSSFVLVPPGFANFSVSSLSTGVEVPYFRVRGSYNPSRLPFFSALSETSLVYTKDGEKKWLLSISFEIAPKTVIESNYIFYTKTGELKGVLTRSYQQLGIHFGWFWTTKKKRKKADVE